MVQQILYTDEKEDKIIEKYSKLWNLSKVDSVKKIIRVFDESNKGK